MTDDAWITREMIEAAPTIPLPAATDDVEVRDVTASHTRTPTYLPRAHARAREALNGREGTPPPRDGPIDGAWSPGDPGPVAGTCSYRAHVCAHARDACSPDEGN
jgi:hypothetical protein